ncbi:MAG: amidohydrolase family protein [Gammaproteobacteria bacterium]|nr:amidohydrolase family protein [Gammaproteobacteria bacterium]
MHSLQILVLGLMFTMTGAFASEAPLFDVHIHYSHDVWDKIPPERAILKLREAGITRAMVSSSSDEGTQRLYRAAPDLIIPALRPYRERGDLETWMHDESVVPYLEQRLERHRYAAIGEFHIDGEEAELPVVRWTVQLAKRYDLMLHVHSDADAIERIFKQDSSARILWAHAGFENGSRVREMLERYPNLWADLSFRWEIHRQGRFTGVWKALLEEHSDRFMLGVDTYTPLRWLQIQETLDWYEALFASLSETAARRIRHDNAERVFAFYSSRSD